MAIPGKTKGKVDLETKSEAAVAHHRDIFEVALRKHPDELRANEQESNEVEGLPRPTIRELAVEHLKHPDEWLDHPNPNFGGRTPNQLIAAGEEDKLYNLFRCAELDLF